MIKRVIGSVVVVLLTTVAILFLGKQPEPLAEGSESANILASQRYGVIRENIRLVDNTRSTQT